MPKGCKIKAYAKVNLILDVMDRREDGYHNLKSVMQTVSLYDDVELRQTCGGRLALKTNLGFLPCNERNVAYRAAQAFYTHTGLPMPGLEIAISKRIPVCAGLGGGSADAAAVLQGLCAMYEMSLGQEWVKTAALAIGADVPFCLEGGTMLAEGIGEVLKRLSPLPFCHILIVNPPVSLSTKAVFSQYRPKEDCHADIGGMLTAIGERDIPGIARRLHNDLEEVSAGRYQVIGRIKQRMLACGALGAVMSGSGPTVIGLFLDLKQAERAYCCFKPNYPETYLSRPTEAKEASLELF